MKKLTLTLMLFALTGSMAVATPIKKEQRKISPIVKSAPIQKPMPMQKPEPKPQVATRGETLSTPQISPEEQRVEVMAKVMVKLQPKLNMSDAIRYANEIEYASNQNGLDPIWVLSVLYQENKFISQGNSDAGAIGIMQVLPSTAVAMGANPSDLYNPISNIQIGIKYLAYLNKRFKSLRLAIIAYNQGEGNVYNGSYQTWYYNGVSQKRQLILNSLG